MSKIAWAAVVLGLVVLLLVLLAASLYIPFAGRALDGGLLRPEMMLRYGFPYLLMRGAGMLLFWILIFAVLVWVLSTLWRGAPTPAAAFVPADSPLDILKRRYARGEISREQFEEMKGALGL